MGANFIAVGFCNGLCIVNTKDAVQVFEMPLQLILLNLCEIESVNKTWLLENILIQQRF